MDGWLMVVIGWGIVGPLLAIGACYVIPVPLSGAVRAAGRAEHFHLVLDDCLDFTDNAPRNSSSGVPDLPRRLR